ncbi:hypothetical protein RFI_21103, partial [Reticulomyxa filosa]
MLQIRIEVKKNKKRFQKLMQTQYQREGSFFGTKKKGAKFFRIIQTKTKSSQILGLFIVRLVHCKIQMRGLVMKRTSGFPFRWNSRILILFKNGKLQWHHPEDERNSSGVAELNVANITNMQTTEISHSKKAVGFMITTKDRALYLSVKNQQECIQWFNAINTVIRLTTSAIRIQELLKELNDGTETNNEITNKDKMEEKKSEKKIDEELLKTKSPGTLLEMANELALFQQLDKAKEIYEYLLKDTNNWGWEDLHISYEFFLSQFCNQPKDAESHFLKLYLHITFYIFERVVIFCVPVDFLQEPAYFQLENQCLTIRFGHIPCSLPPPPTMDYNESMLISGVSEGSGIVQRGSVVAFNNGIPKKAKIDTFGDLDSKGPISILTSVTSPTGTPEHNGNSQYSSPFAKATTAESTMSVSTSSTAIPSPNARSGNSNELTNFDNNNNNNNNNNNSNDMSDHIVVHEDDMKKQNSTEKQSIGSWSSEQGRDSKAMGMGMDMDTVGELHFNNGNNNGNNNDNILDYNCVSTSVASRRLSLSFQESFVDLNGLGSAPAHHMVRSLSANAEGDNNGDHQGKQKSESHFTFALPSLEKTKIFQPTVFGQDAPMTRGEAMHNSKLRFGTILTPVPESIQSNTYSLSSLEGVPLQASQSLQRGTYHTPTTKALHNPFFTSHHYAQTCIFLRPHSQQVQHVRK